MRRPSIGWRDSGSPCSAPPPAPFFLLSFLDPSRTYILRYENLRCPLPINVNPYLLLGDDPNATRNKNQVASLSLSTPSRCVRLESHLVVQVLKAASHIVAVGKFALALRAGDLEPDRLDKNTPLDMFQLTRILGTTRIPQQNRSAPPHSNLIELATIAETNSV